MLDLISSILGSSAPVELVAITGCCLLLLFFVVVIDLVYRIFSHFWK